MRARPFNGDDDAKVVADLVAAAPARNPRCSYWHVGDVWWGLYRRSPAVFDPREDIRIDAIVYTP